MQHILVECPAWTEERGVLVSEIVGNLSLSTVIRTAVKREQAWRSFASFCVKVMMQKEAANRERRGEMAPPPAPAGDGLPAAMRPTVGIPPRRGCRRLMAHLRAPT